MALRPETYVALAASSGKVGLVCLEDTELLDWEISIAASQSVDGAFEQATYWLRYYRPEVVITEDIPEHSRKGDNTRAVVEAIRAAADDLEIPWVEVVPVKRFDNKFKAAAHIATEYPQLAPWLPEPRRPWEAEDRKIILFEAITLWLEYAKVRFNEDTDTELA